MNLENTGLEIVDLAAFRATKIKESKKEENEVVTEVCFAITRGGTVVPTAQRVAELHVLAVLGWCLDLSTNMLDSYINRAH
jgi:hypothetical protein